MDEDEHEVYGGEIPDDMDADVDISRSDEDASKSQELEEMKRRLKEMEEEAAALRDMHAKVEKEMGSGQDPNGVATNQPNKEEADARSIYVGNWNRWFDAHSSIGHNVTIQLKAQMLTFVVFGELWACCYLAFLVRVCTASCDLFIVEYACTPEEVQQHFQSCGTVNRVTILTDKFGQPKGFAYVEFVEAEAVQEALQLNDSELHGRQLRVAAKRTNVPGLKQFRPGRYNPYMAYPYSRPYMPPYYASPYGYGRFPRFRRPMRYRPYF
ncbi:hypothetical protein ZIOFF_025841 [Zingiber officinale]|uniref:RRM domain-containing protein n=1 Tax=Zingiber officinale TaxID=94328 RepID=A0A8J5H467_ZINOF|nr:hypothetical protein ZIOFF_025841 [Zingiber officinale]